MSLLFQLFRTEGLPILDALPDRTEHGCNPKEIVQRNPAFLPTAGTGLEDKIFSTDEAPLRPHIMGSIGKGRDSHLRRSLREHGAVIELPSGLKDMRKNR